MRILKAIVIAAVLVLFAAVVIALLFGTASLISFVTTWTIGTSALAMLVTGLAWLAWSLSKEWKSK